MADKVLKVDPAMVVLTPYALARSSHHLFSMARGYQEEKDSLLARHYIFCASIELGLKAAILGEDCTFANKDSMKSIGHDLLNLRDAFEAVFAVSLFSPEDVEALEKINPHFKLKALEYFTLPILVSALQAHKNLPTLESIESAAGKVNNFLAEKQFFIEGKTTQPTAGGVLNFV